MATITPLPGKPFTPDGRDRPRVLMVEDDALVAIMIKNFLGQIGCAVVGPFTDIDVAMITAQVEPIDAPTAAQAPAGDYPPPAEEVVTPPPMPFGDVVAAAPPRPAPATPPSFPTPSWLGELPPFFAGLLRGGGRPRGRRPTSAPGGAAFGRPPPPRAHRLLHSLQRRIARAIVE